ncbi:MAG: Cof-type HAD-IIB family hydrolase [Clostridiales bacterium]|nr:Cof-type HAD-IIB family hydrolase [Clostridiales bacterium]
MPKIVFLDIDGTLVDYETRVPPSAVRAIRAARSRGHRVYFCTGRSRAEIYPELWDIGVDGMIGGNGSYVEDDGQVLLHQTLSLEQCRHVVDWLHGRGLEFYVESNSGLYGSEHFREAGQPTIQKYSKRKEVANAEQLTVEDVFPEMIFGGDLYRDDVNKISFILSLLYQSKKPL